MKQIEKKLWKKIGHSCGDRNKFGEFSNFGKIGQSNIYRTNFDWDFKLMIW